MQQHGPWQIKDSKIVFENTWVRLRVDEVISPAGDETVHTVYSIQPGVSVLPMDDEGNVTLIRSFHYATGDSNLEPVSGGIEPQEDALAAAKRELAEETRLEAREWIDLGVTEPMTVHISSPQRHFLARGIQPLVHPTDPNEPVDEIVTLPFEAVIAKVMNGEITDAGSIVCILRANEYLRTHSQ